MGADHDGSQPRGPMGPLTPLGMLLEPLYRGAIARINRRRDRGEGVERLGVPVVSVGNLSVGGTGKTPMVMHVVGALLRAGRRPCIAMRGYAPTGAKTEGGPDEADSYRRALPGVPVVARPDRAAGVRNLLEAGGPERPDCVVLDDGFQHRQIARELDIVLVDASRPPLEDRLLPAGWLREPVESLRRAGAIVLTHAELVDEGAIERLLDGLRSAAGWKSGGGVEAVCRHVWTHLEIGDGRAALDWLIGKRVVGCCGIGHPRAFERSLRATVGSSGLVEMMALRDHDPFSPATVRRLVETAGRTGAAAIVVTDKDWSKLRRTPEADWPCPVVRPRLEMVFDRGGLELESRVLSAVSGLARGGRGAGGAGGGGDAGGAWGT